MKLYENIKEMQKTIHYTEESLIISEKENQIREICEILEHTKKQREIDIEEMKFNYEMLLKLKDEDELPGIKSFKGDTNEIIKQYKELMEKKKDFDISKQDIANFEKDCDNLEKIRLIENQIERKKRELEISRIKEGHRYEENMAKIRNDHEREIRKINLDLERYKQLEDLKNDFDNSSKIEEIKQQISQKEQELRKFQENKNMEKDGHKQFLLELEQNHKIRNIQEDIEWNKKKYEFRYEFEKKRQKLLEKKEKKLKEEDEYIEKMKEENNRLKNEKEKKIEEEYKEKLLEIEKKKKEEEENIIHKQNNLTKMKNNLQEKL